MPSVLGIDAAWTVTEPSGVSLLAAEREGDWRCAAVAPSYGSFLALAAGTPVDWTARPEAAPVDPGGAARRGEHAGRRSGRCRRRRHAARHRTDRGEAARGRRRLPGLRLPRRLRALPLGPPAGPPSPTRCARGFAARGYRLATAATGRRAPALIEVYPHASLLSLTGAAYRIPYKVQRSARYHPGTGVRERIRRLHAELASILDHLRDRLGGIDIALPAVAAIPSLRLLKRYEDALDGLVCAWSALRYRGWRGPSRSVTRRPPSGCPVPSRRPDGRATRRDGHPHLRPRGVGEDGTAGRTRRLPLS